MSSSAVYMTHMLRKMSRAAKNEGEKIKNRKTGQRSNQNNPVAVWIFTVAYATLSSITTKMPKQNKTFIKMYFSNAVRCPHAAPVSVERHDG